MISYATHEVRFSLQRIFKACDNQCINIKWVNDYRMALIELRDPVHALNYGGLRIKRIQGQFESEIIDIWQEIIDIWQGMIAQTNSDAEQLQQIAQINKIMESLSLESGLRQTISNIEGQSLVDVKKIVRVIEQLLSDRMLYKNAKLKRKILNTKNGWLQIDYLLGLKQVQSTLSQVNLFKSKKIPKQLLIRCINTEIDLSQSSLITNGRFIRRRLPFVDRVKLVKPIQIEGYIQEVSMRSINQYLSGITEIYKINFWVGQNWAHVFAAQPHQILQAYQQMRSTMMELEDKQEDKLKQQQQEQGEGEGEDEEDKKEEEKQEKGQEEFTDKRKRRSKRNKSLIQFRVSNYEEVNKMSLIGVNGTAHYYQETKLRPFVRGFMEKQAETLNLKWGERELFKYIQRTGSGSAHQIKNRQIGVVFGQNNYKSSWGKPYCNDCEKEQEQEEEQELEQEERYGRENWDKHRSRRSQYQEQENEDSNYISMSNRESNYMNMRMTMRNGDFSTQQMQEMQEMRNKQKQYKIQQIHLFKTRKNHFIRSYRPNYAMNEKMIQSIDSSLNWKYNYKPLTAQISQLNSTIIDQALHQLTFSFNFPTLPSPTHL